MSEDSTIRVEEVESVEAPPKARVGDVETAPEKLERKRDYLEGFLAAKPAAVEPSAVGGDLYEAVIDALKEIFDPEIPVNIYDLGLIYDLNIDAKGDAVVTMTLTAPACPVAGSMPKEVADRVSAVEGIGEVDVVLTWDPPWTPANMSEVAKVALDMF